MLGNGEELKKEKCVVEFDSGERCDGKSSQYRGREKILRKITIAFKIGPDTKKDRINLSGCVKTISPSPDKELKFLARQECRILRETFKNRTYLEKFK